MNYRFVGSHAETLDGGRPIEPGEFIELSDEDLSGDRIAGFVEDGLLIETDADQQFEATPAAEQLAAENEINLAAITGSGANGRIIESDVERYIAETAEEG
jgi:pyruvate/2-oxoglutarate dehydrogenase complex dihydrolipoamide acyltransferase (E2) component